MGRGGALCSQYPIIFCTRLTGSINNLRIKWIKDDISHPLNKPVFRKLCSILYPLGIIHKNTDCPDPSCTGVCAGIILTGFSPRVAEYALLGLTVCPVIVRLFIRACTYTEPPCTAYILIEKDNTVLTPLIQST